VGVVTGHIAGAPLEELLVPLMSTGGVLLLAVRQAVASYLDRRRRSPQGDSLPEHS
jgi:hypothetical protein